MRIVPFNEITEEMYVDYISEWEKTDEKIIPSSSARKGDSFAKLLENWENDRTEKAYAMDLVPSTLYFMIDETKRIIGSIHFRHELNSHLFKGGGHIGYGVRPSERRKGMASLMLGMFLDMLRKEGKYKRVLITCDESNKASVGTIEKNGGKMENVVRINGVPRRRYWIEL
ncbi:MAG: GNAT family N-acetyltransferase [Clostridia bacterium]